jgi:replicative DNA helicase
VNERALPQNDEAERAVLGAILLNNERLLDAQEHVSAADFHRDAHRRIFERMVALGAQHRAIDLLTLREALAGELDEVGGAVYISALIDGVPHGTNTAHYARIVREKADLRRMIFAGNKMLAAAYAAEDSAEEILEQAEKTILGLADRTVSVGFESMRAIAPRALELIERAHANRGAISGVPTGFVDLDNLTRGLQPGTLIVCGARPGMGKTSIGQNIAHNAAAAGKVVGLFNLEMPNEELFIRQIASYARIDSHRLQSGFVNEHEWTRISEAVSAIAEASVYSDETPAIGSFEVRSRARRLKAEKGLDLLILDYLQLMATDAQIETRALAIGAITTDLKALAKELKIPILILAQLNREQDKQGRKPRLSDLRDSGSIEQDADIVMFLYRPENPHDDERGITELIVAKHRNGPIGTIKLTWSEQITRFDNYNPYEEPADQRLPMGDR